MKVLAMLKPPAFGEPCNGCGRCCREEICALGQRAFGHLKVQAPCPALREHSGRTWCMVIEEADKVNIAYGSHLRLELGIGFGCDADFSEGDA